MDIIKNINLMLNGQNSHEYNYIKGSLLFNIFFIDKSIIYEFLCLVINFKIYKKKICDFNN